MNWVRLGGIGLTTLGVGGYAVGVVVVAYPGRALSITALMVGITLIAVGGST